MKYSKSQATWNKRTMSSQIQVDYMPGSFWVGIWSLIFKTASGYWNSERASSLPKVRILMSVRAVVQIQIFTILIPPFSELLSVFTSAYSSSTVLKFRKSIPISSFFLCYADFSVLIIYAKNQINTITCVYCLSKQDVPTYKMESPKFVF